MASVQVGQKAVGISAVRFTVTTGQTLETGIKLSVSTAGKCYYGYSDDLTTTAKSFYINGVAEIHPRCVNNIGGPSQIYFISDTASQYVTFDTMGQLVEVS